MLRWVSAEPLLGPIDFHPYLDGSFSWIITGCEQAGVGKRQAMDINWVRDIDKQCFFKQRYDGGRIVHDGLLDGVILQAWPMTISPYRGRPALSSPQVVLMVSRSCQTEFHERF